MFRTARVVWLDVITSGATLATITTAANRNAALRARAALDLAAEGTPAVLDLTDDGAAVDENTVNKTHHGHGNPADPRGYLARALDTVVPAVLDGTNPDTGKPYTKAQRAKVEQAVTEWVEQTRTLWDRSGAASTREGMMLTRDGGRLTAYALAPEGYDPLAPVEQ